MLRSLLFRFTATKLNARKFKTRRQAGSRTRNRKVFFESLEGRLLLTGNIPVFSLAATAAAQVEVTDDNSFIIDDLDAGFSSTGFIATSIPAQGYNGNVHYAAEGNGSDTATWSFTNLPDGLYEVSDTWSPYTNRATDAPFTIIDGTVSSGTTVGTVDVNQKVAPDGFADSGVSWNDLNGPYRISSGTLTVELTNSANGYVIADAVRIQRLSEPKLAVLNGTNVVANSMGTVAFGTADYGGSGVDKTITLENIGDLPLNITNPPVLPTGYSLVGTFPTTPVTLAPYTGVANGPDETTFIIQLNANQLGPFNGQVSIANSDTVANPFTFNLTGSVVGSALSIAPTNASQVETSSGSQPFTFTITRSGDTSSATTVDYAVTGSGTTPATATNFTGNALPSGTVSFSVGQSSQMVTINIQGTTAIEPNEGFTVTLSHPSASATLATATAMGLIENNDSTTSTTLAIAGTTATQVAASSGSTPFTFTIIRSGDTNSAATVDYSVTGSGTNPATASNFTGDTLPSGTVSFAVSQSNQVVTINVNGSTAIETDEEFTVTLSNPSAPATITTATALGDIENNSGIIIDDSDPGFSSTGFATSSAPAQGYEGSVHYAAPGNNTAAATWTFTNLQDGLYEVSDTWSPYTNRATNAPFTIINGTVSSGTTVGKVNVDQKVAPDGFTDSGVSWNDLGGPYPVSSGTLTVELTNSANGYVIADAVRIQRLSEPKLAVLNGTNVVADSTGTVTFGTANYGGSGVDKTITLENIGDLPMSITSPPVLPTGYSLVGTFPTTPVTLAPYNGVASGPDETTFTIQLNANQLGPFNGQVSIANSDTTANPFTFNLTGSVVGSALSIAPTNATQVEASSGSQPFTFTITRSGDTSSATTVDYAVTGSGTTRATASNFTGNTLPSGTVSFGAGITTKVITINVAGSTTVQTDEGFTVTLRHPSAPATLTTATAMGLIENNTSTTLAITGTTATQVAASSGSTPFTFTVTRSGDTDASSTVNYTVTGSGTNPATASNFTGNVLPSGTVSFGAGQATQVITINVNGNTAIKTDEGFTVTLSNPSAPATITTATAVGNIESNSRQIIDDSDPGFSSVGFASTSVPAQGYDGNVHFAAAGNGSDIATWTFTSLNPGIYEVSATWSPYANRATNAPYTIIDGKVSMGTTLGTVHVDQKNAPDGFTDADVSWNDLGGPYDVSSGTLTVKLTNAANGYVIADAVRIEYVGPLPVQNASPAIAAPTVGSSGVSIGSTKEASDALFTKVGLQGWFEL